MICTMYSCDVIAFERSFYDDEIGGILSFDMSYYNYIGLSSTLQLFCEILLGKNGFLPKNCYFFVQRML